MINGPRTTKTRVQVSSPLMSAQAVPPLQTGPMSGALANPYLSYPNVPPPPLLWYGQAPIYHPPFPLPHPQLYMVPLMTSVLPTPPIKYPLIAEWLVQCDDHPQCSSEDFTNLVPKFDKEGFRRLHQLTGGRITVEKLSEWLGIGKGTADLILRYAEEDIAAIRARAFQMPPGGVGSLGQNFTQPPT